MKLYCFAGAAKPSPKIGQSLGPLGLNMMQFCKEFNERTGHIRPDVPMRVMLRAYADRSFKFVAKPPPTSWFLKKFAGIEEGSPYPKHYSVGMVSIKYIYELAKIKQELDPDLKNKNLLSIVKMIISTADTMGIEVIED